AVSSAMSATTQDGTPPAPDPMTWAVVPHATGPNSISMTASVATDPSGVEYYFANLTDPNHDSGWQDSTNYVDSPLPERTGYVYAVKARDKSGNLNETAMSAAFLVTTQDGTAPTPDPMIWEMEPYVKSAGSIFMKATTAIDPNGVEYYFANITDPAHDSGWQDSRTYLDTGLTERTEYYYTVKARDKSGNLNETAASAPRSATTMDGTPPTPDPMAWATAPYATSTSSISMTAVTASDPNGVQYYFFNITDPAHDSGWQGSAMYVDLGLNESTRYTYRVKARDKSPSLNETQVSPAGKATTLDGTPPNPNPMTWAVVPFTVGPNEISMTATTASDLSGVEYYFANITDPAHDSGWQLSSTYNNT
ncbi:MAG: hypothetical protein KAR47_19860, partial [Planctomycetes bacterium]|nr:hypothetical protein [Planctomycetota bacterium]